MMLNLLPCPFCGAEPKVLHDRDGIPIGIHCKCGAMVKFLFAPQVIGETSRDAEKRLIERYNRRTREYDEYKCYG